MDKNFNYLPAMYVKNCSEKKLIDGILQIPCQKPPIKNVIYTRVTPSILNVIPIDHSIIVVGTIKIEIEYCADVPTQDEPVHYCHFDIHYTHLICLEKCCVLPNNFSKNDITVVVKFKNFEVVGIKEIYFSILLDFLFSNKVIHKNYNSMKNIRNSINKRI